MNTVIYQALPYDFIESGNPGGEVVVGLRPLRRLHNDSASCLVLQLNHHDFKQRSPKVNTIWVSHVPSHWNWIGCSCWGLLNGWIWLHQLITQRYVIEDPVVDLMASFQCVLPLNSKITLKPNGQLWGLRDHLCKKTLLIVFYDIISWTAKCFLFKGFLSLHICTWPTLMFILWVWLKVVVWYDQSQVRFFETDERAQKHTDL